MASLVLPDTRWGWARAIAVAVALVAGVVWLVLPHGGFSYETMYGAAIESDLKNLATLQGIYFEEHGTYTGDPLALGFAPSAGVLMQLRGAEDGWAAWATPSGPEAGEGCGLYHGSSGPHEGSAVQPDRPDEIACTMRR